MKAQPSSVRMLPEETILSAWREQVAQAAQTPAVRRQLLFGQPELLPKFAAQYQRLKALPRHVRRALQRKWKQSLAGVALLLAMGQAPALAATINVGGGCKLVDAIIAANTDNAIGLCTAGSGADRIVLPANSTQTLTAVNNLAEGANGLPVVTSTITIAGNGSTIARSSAAGTPEFRIFAVDSGGNLTLRQTTVSGGRLSGEAPGGGVANGGALTLIGCTISGNSAFSGGGLFLLFEGTLTVTNSTISGNTATERGGGVFNYGRSLLSDPGTLVVTNSTISGNRASYGGGVANRGSLILTNSTISGNTAINPGGNGDGGGVYNNGGTVTHTNSTLSRNTAGRVGGGVYNAFGKLTLTSSTVSGNSARAGGGGVYNSRNVGDARSDVVLTRSLIAGNTAPSGAEIYQFVGGVVATGPSNLFGHSGLTNARAFANFVPGGTDIIATSDGNTPTALPSILNPTPASNGGLTQTHALASNSPAIDAVPTGCPPPANDQRGVRRPQDGNNDSIAHCDIGAFERVRPGTVTCDGLPATKVGTSASETLTGTPGRDVIQGLAGNDLIRGLAGNDVVCGGVGNDRLFGGAGEDRLFGEAGVDQLNGQLDFDRCDGGPPATGDTATNCEQVSAVP